MATILLSEAAKRKDTGCTFIYIFKLYYANFLQDYSC